MSGSIEALENEILSLKDSLPKSEEPAVGASIQLNSKPIKVISVPHYAITWHESAVTALLSPGNGNEEPTFSDQALEVEVPSNYLPSPPVCSSYRGRSDWLLSRIDIQRAWHNLFKCCGKHAKICTPPDFAQFVIPEW